MKLHPLNKKQFINVNQELLMRLDFQEEVKKLFVQGNNIINHENLILSV